MGVSDLDSSSRGRSAPDLSARLRDILWATVREYVECPEPVSSRAALERSGLELSPATVRSAMAELEEAGLLTQPHASSGRVPTDRAFRAYVDEVLRSVQEGQGRAAVSLALPPSTGEPASLLRVVADTLSRATGQLGFSFGLAPDRAPLRELRFVRVSMERVMALLVYGSGVVQSRIFDDTETNQVALDRAAARLSESVGGRTLLELRRWLASELAIDRARRDRVWQRAIRLARAGTETTPDEEVPFYLGDRVSLLAHPEFEDVGRLREILTALDEKERMLALLDQILRARALCVVLGDEIEDPQIRSCAVVMAPVGPGASGGIGVIGPVRMRYDRVIPVVRSMSERIADYLG